MGKNKFEIPNWIVNALGGTEVTRRIANDYIKEIKAAGFGPNVGITMLLLALEAEAEARLDKAS